MAVIVMMVLSLVALFIGDKRLFNFLIFDLALSAMGMAVTMAVTVVVLVVSFVGTVTVIVVMLMLASEMVVAIA